MRITKLHAVKPKGQQSNSKDRSWWYFIDLWSLYVWYVFVNLKTNKWQRLFKKRRTNHLWKVDLDHSKSTAVTNYGLRFAFIQARLIPLNAPCGHLIETLRFIHVVKTRTVNLLMLSEERSSNCKLNGVGWKQTRAKWICVFYALFHKPSTPKKTQNRIKWGENKSQSQQPPKSNSEFQSLSFWTRWIAWHKFKSLTCYVKCREVPKTT